MPEHKPTAPDFSAEIDGRTYMLCYSRGNYADAEWALGTPLISTAEFFEKAREFTNANNVPPFRFLEIMLFVGLQKYLSGAQCPAGGTDNPVRGMSFDALREYIADKDADKIFPAVLQGWLQNSQQGGKPDQEGEPAKGDPLPQTSGGTEPGESAATTSA